MLKQFEDKMQKSLDSMANDFMTIRAGRANPHVLDKVKVDYYGVATPVAQVGNVSVPEARTIMIQPWEPNLLKEIEKAILVSSEISLISIFGFSNSNIRALLLA